MEVSHLKFHIGDKVTFDYNNRATPVYIGEKGNTRKIIRYRDSVDWPLAPIKLNGIITGAKKFYEGEVFRERTTRDYWGDYDYEPGGLSVSRTVYCYVIRLGLLNREIPFFVADLQPTKKKFSFKYLAKLPSIRYPN